ncbi:MAG: site-2 protease family protein [Bernardetiaceae bacterium]|nr:site-2 protease family protein [Bernardetiaceae bacterium]
MSLGYFGRSTWPWRHLLLLVLTLGCTTVAGAEWMYGRMLWQPEPRYQMEWGHFWAGLQFSLPFLGILTAHEFGHYFVARWYQLKVSLPYYLPFWLGWLGLPHSIGTMGAFIRIGSTIQSRKVFFDVGIAGPLAGFVAALAVLWYGFTHLPPPEYIFEIHPEYKQYGLAYALRVYREAPPGGLILLGDNAVFWFFKTYVADPARLPHANEIIHYPLLLAGYLALFFTALNLLPIGQLDGGHILFGLIGERWHRRVSAGLFVGFVFYAGLGLFSPHVPPDLPPEADPNEDLYYLPLYLVYLYFVFSRLTNSRLRVLLIAVAVLAAQYLAAYVWPQAQGYAGWLLFALLLGRLGIYHPPTPERAPLSRGRQWLGWLALLVFALCFSPQPLGFK